MGAWEDAKDAANARAGATSALLDRKLGSADLNREVQAQRAFGTTPLKPKAPDTMDFKDEGEAKPGSTLGQAVRARGIAKAQMNQSSSVGHEAPTETDLHANGPWVPRTERGTAAATGSGPDAGAMMGVSNKPKDLGRATAKVVRGEMGDVSPKTMGQVKGSFLSRAADSVSKGVGETLGAYGGASLAVKAQQAFKGMQRGESVNPLTLDTSPEDPGKSYLTPNGRRKGIAPPVES
jgi:hypothetical protein